MADDGTDWLPGQPAPWLAAYGPVTSPIVPPAPGPTLAPMQPGLGIPAAAVDQAVNNAANMPPQEPPWLAQPGLAGIPGAAIDHAVDVAGQQEPAPTADHEAPHAANPAAPEVTPPGVRDMVGPVGVEPRARSAENLTAIALDPNAPIAARQAAIQQLAPEQRAALVNGADPKQLAALASSSMSPEELATIAIRHEGARQHEESAARLDLARKADEEAAHAWQSRQVAVQQATAATAQVEADAKAISMEQIDPGEHGVGNFIASVITSALGGAMSQYTGGRDLALEELDKVTQRRIDAQKANIANRWQGVNFKRNLIAEQYQRGTDEYRATETYRIATYDRAITELQTKMQDYDPVGTTALRGAMAVQQIQGQRAAALETVWQQHAKLRLEADKVAFDKQKAETEARQKAEAQAETERHNKASVASANYGHSVSRANAQDALKAETARLEATRAQHVADKASEDEQKYGIPGITTKDGKMFIAKGNDTAAQKLRDKVTAAKMLVKAIDEVRAIGIGHRFDVGNSDELQRIRTLWANNKVIAKDLFGLGAISESDEKLIDDALGTGDPTGIRNKEAAIKQARASFVSLASGALHGQGLPDDVDFDIPDIVGAPKPTDSPEDAAFKSALGKDPAHMSADDLNREFNVNERNVDALAAEASKAGFDSVHRYLIQKAGGLLPSQRAIVDQLSWTLTSPDPSVTAAMRQAASDRLDTLGDNAETAAVRSLAKARLRAAAEQAAATPASPGDSAPATNAAHETVP